MKAKFLITTVVLAFLCSCGGADRSGNNYDVDKSVMNTESDYTKSTPSGESSPMAEYESVEENVTENERKKVEAANDDFISSVAAMVSTFDTSRKFIRTADLKFRVENLRKSTYAIEDIIIRYKGFVTYTHLNTDVRYKKETQISKDSILESTYYTMRNTMTLRVPNKDLDTVIRLIGRHIDNLDYRTIQAQDITIDLFANKLKQKRFAKYQSRLGKAIDEKGKKLNDIEGAENSLLAKAEAEDNALLENMRTMDKVEYSTINLYLYEREKILHDLIPNEKNIAAYEPSFWSKIGKGFYNGWLLIEELLIAIANIWSVLLLIVLVVYFALKKVKSITKKMYDK